MLINCLLETSEAFLPLKGHDKGKLSLNGEALKCYQDAFVNISNLPPMKILYEKNLCRPVKPD